MSKIKYCVFDYDDTLMQTRECKTQALVELGRRRFGKTVDPEAVEQHWGIAHGALFQKLFDVTGAELQAAMAAYQELDHEFPLVPHADASAELLRLQESYTLVIVSSCTRELIEKQLASSQLSDIRFAKIFGCDETTHHKPSGRVFDTMFDHFSDMTRENVVYIGDGHKDFLAAQDRGIPFLGIDRAAKETHAMIGDGAKVLQSLSLVSKAVE